MRNAYSYIRMSTDLQLKGDSLRRQLEASSAYAKEHSLNLIDHLANEKLHDIGVSGFKGQNAKTGVLARFLDALTAGDIPNNSVLLVESLDRLSRDRVSSALGQFLMILEHGIEIVTVSDRQIYTKDTINQNSGQLFVSLGIMIRANDESEMKSKRINAVWEHKRSQADSVPLTSVCPAWLRLSKESGKFEEIKERVEVVKKIFALCTNTCGIYAIARHLNETGVPVFGRSEHWHMSYVQKILSNRAVLGEFQPKKRVDGKLCAAGALIHGYYPKIISEQEFLLAKVAQTQRSTVDGGGRKGVGFSNLLGGLLYCGTCGSRMMMKNRGGSSYETKTLVCNRQTVKGACDMKEWRLDQVETALLRHLDDIDFSQLDDKQLRSRRARLNDELAALERAIAGREQEIARNIDFVQGADFSQSMKQKFADTLKRLEGEIDQFTKRRSEAEQERAACDETEHVMNSKVLKTLLTTLKVRENDYIYRANVNQALKKAIASIELKYDYFKFQEWDYHDGSPEVVAFRKEKISRNKLPLREVVKRKKFAAYCSGLHRRIVVHYRNGALRGVDMDSGLSFKSITFNHQTSLPTSK